LFELRIERTTPPLTERDLESVLAPFLQQIGYLQAGDEAKGSESLPYRLFVNHFLLGGNQVSNLEELTSSLSTTPPTIYRHLNKLKALDLIEEVGGSVSTKGWTTKGWRLRYGSLALAFSFTETNVIVAMGNYRKVIDASQKHLVKTSGRKKKEQEDPQGPTRSKRFSFTVADMVVGDDPQNLLLELLTKIGYISTRGPAESKDLTESLPWRLLVDCLLAKADRFWQVEELASELDTTVPTIYRHLNKLKALDILEEIGTSEGSAPPRISYRIRFSNLSQAWTYPEIHTEAAMETYRKTVDHIQELVDEQR